ncbi:porin [Azohydromonas lata]|uniref:Porin n=1 Tax=Azohydromonas lata TaxID=45677 RepID=A0ABU5IGG0_9BURK|nr:porin [Azohydromonas lata]MDZ5458217.1 porin [Azohydromonas lata]
MKLKHSLIALAALAAVSAANAQSNVTLYGRVDLGYQFNNKVNAAGDSLSELKNGGIAPSIWGLRGTEDLGSGLSAFFNLESHFYGDTGQLEGAGRLFRRQANLGVKGAFGSVALGRQYSPALLAHLGTDPRGFKEQFSMLYPYALNQTTAPDTLNDLGIFLANAVSYTNSFGPVNVGAAYAFGEQAGKFSAGRTASIGGSYTGPVTVSASYQQIKNVAGTGDTKQWGLGGAVPLGPVKAKILYLRTKSDAGVLAGAETNVGVWGVGVDYVWGANTSTVAYYQGKDKETSGALTDKTKTLVLSNDYALSKRTTLYAQLAYADYDAGSTARTSIIAGPVVAGEKQTVFGLGIKHDF